LHAVEKLPGHVGDHLLPGLGVVVDVGHKVRVDLAVFSPEEYRRFLGTVDPDLMCHIHDDPQAWEEVVSDVAWELLYRMEPELYARLTAGERLHPGILGWIPQRIDRAVEVGCGWGRLTLQLAPRCGELIGLEPAEPLRRGLESLLERAGHRHCEVLDGFLNAIPVPDGWADMTFTCSAFSCDSVHGGDPGLAELDRVTRTGGVVVLVWPPRNRKWLEERGFQLVGFPGDLGVEFASLQEAVELAQIFYPAAAGAVAARGSRRVPWEVLGIGGPNALAWRTVTR
ncbi:MAG TPA: methyltransferase domain-containing protein, partial [Actinomycetota bacterium]|nr:methyltransferase domain-containing protein [Actinomycetota bacterium]